MEYLPYTYLIGWSKLNKWYYGVEYGIKKIPCANPDNFWTSYFTSSSIVSKFRITHGEPDVVQVRKIFNFGTIEERMEQAITWEKRVLSKIDITKDIWLNGRIGGNICSVNTRKIAQLKYGVINVFQSEEIKEKSKKTNLKKYGVEHPSHSKDLLEKKKQNNIIKYGVPCTFNLPHIRDKALQTIRKEETKIKRKETIISIYGVEHISQNARIKEIVADKRKETSNRQITKLIREYKRVFGIKLPSGWYQMSDDKLEKFLNEIQLTHGIHLLEDLSAIVIDKKYSSSISILKERPIVKKIFKYKNRYGKKLNLGRNWYRKKESDLDTILLSLIAKYGTIE